MRGETRGATPKIDVRHVSKTFLDAQRQHRWRCRDVSLQIMAGEFVCLLGPSGCGKTTLLRVMHGLLEPDAGEVLIDGAATATPGAQAGFVFQSFRLLPWRTVIDNITFPLEIQGMPNDAAPRPREPVPAAGRPGKTSRTATRTSCRAGCSSAWGWPGRWRSSPRCC